MATLGSHTLIAPILLTTKNATTGEEQDETLKPAGFVVTLRKPKPKDLKLLDAFDGREIAGTIALIASLSNLDTLEVENLEMEDFGPLGDVLAQAMPSGLATGATASAI